MEIKKEVVDFLNKQPKYSVYTGDNYADSKIVELFTTLEEAQKEYDDFDVMSFPPYQYENDYWRNNKDGREAELRIWEEIPLCDLEELNECESEEEMLDVLHNCDPYHTWSRRIETKLSYLSDDWDDELEEFKIKCNTFAGSYYGTYFGNKPDVVNLKNIR